LCVVELRPQAGVGGDGKQGEAVHVRPEVGGAALRR
jgi:hypothetical protein